MYRQMGYYNLTDAEALFLSIAKLEGMQEGALKTALQEMFQAAFGAPAYKITYVNPGQLEMMSISADSSKFTTQMALTHIVSRYLKMNDRCTLVPEILDYREDPSMTITEAAILTYNDSIKGLGFPLEKPPRLLVYNDIIIAVLVFIRELRRAFGYLQSRINLIRQYGHDIAYRLANSTIDASALTQWDRTFLAHMLTREYGLTKKEREEKLLFNLSPAKRVEDSTIMEMITKLKTYTLEGPKTKYVTMMSSGIPEDIVVYIGPYTPILVSSVGLLTPSGGFKELSARVVEPRAWNPNDHLKAVLEAHKPLYSAIEEMSNGGGAEAESVGILSVTPKEAMRDTDMKLTLRVDRGPSGSKKLGTILDNPELVWMFEWTGADDNVKPKIELGYTSKWRRRFERGLTSLNEVMLDKVMTEVRLTEGELNNTGTPPAGMGLLSLDKFKFVDVHRLEDTRSMQDLNTKVPVAFIRSNRIHVKEVTLRTFFEEKGDKIVRPAFSEYYRPLITDLDIPDEKMEQTLYSYMGLSYREKHLSAPLVRQSMNIFKLEKLFGITIDKARKQLALELAGAGKLGRYLSAADRSVLATSFGTEEMK